MIGIDIAQIPPAEAYKIMIGSVVPRPVAWVSTTDAAGNYNVAPYSFFTAVCSNPPTVLFCPVTPADRDMKDTLANIRETKEFVINVATEDNVTQLNQTSAPYPKGISEFERVGLTPLPGIKVKAPRVAESPIHLECKLTQIIDIGDGGLGSGRIVIGQIVYAHIDETAYGDAHHIDITKIKPVSRLAGTDYAPVREIFSLVRPTKV
jgi:flavin reductase (DIM6/NTAB) family NADH-FMN oxidoreductase RutF